MKSEVEFATLKSVDLMTAQSDRNWLIWDTVRRIPKGKVTTYGDIARICGLIGGARVIGYALRSTPPGMRIPWQRVINSRGMISLPKTNGQYARQKSLLRREGVRFIGERIDLQRYGWIKRFSG